MKQNQISTIYEQLSNAEKAALVFNATLNDDMSTARTISDSVTTKTYTQKDDDFVRRLDDYSDVLAALNAEFWRLNYFSQMWVFRSVCERNNDDIESAVQSMKQRDLSLSQLIALQHVAEEIATRYKLNKRSVCKKIGFNVDDEITPLAELPEYGQSYYDAMLDLVMARIEQREIEQKTKDYLALN